MEHVQVFALVIVAVAVTAVCRNRDWPAPLVLVGVALVFSLIPAVPRYEIQPELLLEFVLPPLLYSAALSSSYRDFRTSLNSITRLGVGLVLVTALVVALVYVWLDDSAIPLLAALTLGAVVAPPDAVAAAAVGRKLGLPRRVMTLLSGESLINDATSLTLYKVAILGVSTGAWALGTGIVIFALAVVVGVAVGLAIALIVQQARLRLDDPVVASAIGLLTPFAVYWGAEQLRGSGVLAVVTAGLYLGHTSPRAGYATRLYEEPIWSTVDLLLESFTFALIGVQLPWVVRDVIASDQGLRHGVMLSFGVLVTVILVRPAYIFATSRFDHLRLRGSHRPAFDSLSARESAVVSWAGMRGVVTLAAAAAIPLTSNGVPFPERATLQLVAYSVAIGTLLAQGLTLPWVTRRLGVGSADETASDAAQEAAVRLATADAVQGVLERQRPEWARYLGTDRANELISKLSDAWRARATAAAVMLDPASADELVPDEGLRPEAVSGVTSALRTVSPSGVPTPSEGKRTQKLQREIVSAQREVLMQWRDSGELDEVVMRRVMRELDLEDESLSSSWLSRVRT